MHDEVGLSLVGGNRPVAALETAHRHRLGLEVRLARRRRPGPRPGARNRVWAASIASSSDRDVVVWRRETALARRVHVALDLLEQRGAVAPTASSARVNFSPLSRRTTVTTPWARSRGPTSTRSGTPLISQSVTRRPKLPATVVDLDAHAGAPSVVAATRSHAVVHRPVRRAPRSRPPGSARAAAAARARCRRRGP